MNCHRCGSTMILKKFCDYGGHSFGWKSDYCGDIMDQTQGNRQRFKKMGRGQDKAEGGHSAVIYREGVGFEWDGI